MAGNLFVLPKQIPLDAGVVLPGSKLTFTQTGTTTPQNTFTDVALTVAHANPVIADSDGVFEAIYFDPTFNDYRVKLDTSADVLVYQVDGIPASQSGQSLTLTAAAPFIDLIENDASVNNSVWRIAVNGEQLTFKVGNDALSLFTDVLTIDRTANTVDTIDLLSTALNHNGVAILSPTTGSFTGTLTGMSGATTGTVQFTKASDQVTLSITAAIQGTSNATTMTMTGLPAAVQPAQDVFVICEVKDNGNPEVGSAFIDNAAPSVITFRIGSPLSTTGFTAAATKGIDGGWTIIYLTS